MIGLDTNVLVRYIAQDDPKQSSRATQLINSLTADSPGYISQVCLVELVWVMQGCYAAKKQEIIAILEVIFSTRELLVENAETAIRALRIYASSKADYADCLIAQVCSSAGCERTVSFDSKALKSAGFTSV